MEPKGMFGRDRMAAGLAACAILLLFVFFYALHQNVAGLGREIEELKSLNSAVLDLDARHAALDGKVTDLGAAAQDISHDHGKSGQGHGPRRRGFRICGWTGSIARNLPPSV